MNQGFLRLKVDAAKSQFFDREPVLRAIGRAAKSRLSRFGARVRARAQSSILRHPVRRGFGVKSKVRDMAGVSEPGTPPFSHLGLLVKFVFFAYESARNAVVVGPAKLNMDGNAPEALEYGKPSVVKRGNRNKPRLEKVMIRARPFMRPAAAAELPGLMDSLKNSVRN